MAWHLSGFSEVDYERLRGVFDRLPPGPFTVSEFLAHATGLNAIRNSSDAQSIIDYLTGIGELVKLDKHVAMWIVAAGPTRKPQR